MEMEKSLLLAASSLILVVSLTTGASLSQESMIRIDGSSTVYPLTEAVTEEFLKENKGRIKVTIGISGTGGGFKKFIRGEIDIQDASRPILHEEMEAARSAGIEFIEIPIVFDAITVVAHPKNTWVDSLTVDELKRIWEPAAQGKVLYWDQIRTGWPHRKFSLFGPGADSGTFDYFTEAVVGKSKSSRGDYTGSEDDNVLIQGVEGNLDALGFIPYAYYRPHRSRLKAIPIAWEKNRVREPVAPSLQNVLDGIYNPLARPLFIYVNKKSAAEKPEVRKFVQFYLENADILARQLRFLPLPDEAYLKAFQRFEEMKAGTTFAGNFQVGVTVGEMFESEPKN